ncbi:MAG: hypothetical protein ACO1NQ_07865 [Flavobacteriales bacterium]
MSSSFFNWLSVGLIMCTTFACKRAGDDWPVSLAVDDGGYIMRMPMESGSQHGTLFLGRDTITSHINILADSGITYASSWFDLPKRYGPLSGPAALDSIWPLIVQRVNGTLISDAPNPWVSDPSVRSGWFLNGDDIRLGVVLRIMGQRMVVMNAATPAPFYDAREERNMLRFLDSFEPR